MLTQSDTQCPFCKSPNTVAIKDYSGGFRAIRWYHDRICEKCGAIWTPPAPVWAAPACIVCGSVFLGLFVMLRFPLLQPHINEHLFQNDSAARGALVDAVNAMEPLHGLLVISGAALVAYGIRRLSKLNSRQIKVPPREINPQLIAKPKKNALTGWRRRLCLSSGAGLLLLGFLTSYHWLPEILGLSWQNRPMLPYFTTDLPYINACLSLLFILAGSAIFYMLPPHRNRSTYLSIDDIFLSDLLTTSGEFFFSSSLSTDQIGGPVGICELGVIVYGFPETSELIEIIPFSEFSQVKLTAETRLQRILNRTGQLFIAGLALLFVGFLFIQWCENNLTFADPTGPLTAAIQGLLLAVTLPLLLFDWFTELGYYFEIRRGRHHARHWFSASEWKSKHESICKAIANTRFSSSFPMPRQYAEATDHNAHRS